MKTLNSYDPSSVVPARPQAVQAPRALDARQLPRVHGGRQRDAQGGVLHARRGWVVHHDRHARGAGLGGFERHLRAWVEHLSVCSHNGSCPAEHICNQKRKGAAPLSAQRRRCGPMCGTSWA